MGFYGPQLYFSVTCVYNHKQDSQHRVVHGRKSPEKVERSGGDAAAELRVSHEVVTGEDSDEFKRCNVESHGNDETERHENCGGAWITPAKKRLHALSL